MRNFAEKSSEISRAVGADRAQKPIPKNARTAPASRLNMETAREWTCEPGAYPALDAQIEGYAERGGPVWTPHVVAKDFIAFGEFLTLSEVTEFFKHLFPIGSDQAHALTWLRERADQLMCSRPESRARLTALIYDSPLLANRGFRYVQNTFGCIFAQYDGLLAVQKRNGRLETAPARKAKRGLAYLERERERKAQRRWARK
jgi:hypothetical protein